jgi:cytochrome P450 family 1 subfamily D
MYEHFISGVEAVFFYSAVHADEETYSDPSLFDPYRFINDDGQFVQKQDNVVFGMGSRRCIGENLAKVEMFYFVTAMLQKFKFRRADECRKLDFSPVSGASMRPKPFNMIAEPRT